LSTLGINSDMLDQFSDWRCLLFPSFSFFSLLLPKPSFFPADYQTYLRKTMISDSFTVGSSWNWSTGFETQLRGFSPLGFMNKCWSWEKYHSLCNFLFLAKTQSCLRKNTIVDSLTVGMSWNFDMLFEIQFHTHSPLGFAR